MTKFDPNASVSSAQLGAVVGVSDRRVRQLENAGVFKKNARGRFPLGESVRAWHANALKAEIAKVETASTPKVDLEREKARKARRENDEAENKLIPIEGAMVVLDLVIGTIRTGLSGLAARITDDIELREVIDREADAVLHDASDTLEKTGGALAEGGDPLTAA